MGVTVFLAPLRRVKALVPETAELALEHRPNFPLELVYHPSNLKREPPWR